jgi:hypothetical protein
VGGCGTAISAPEVGAVARLLTVGVFLSIGRGAGTLGASRDTAVCVVGLAVAWTRNVVALGSAADVSSIT